MKGRNVLIGCAIVLSALFLTLTLVGILLNMSRGRERSIDRVFASAGGDRIGLLYISGVITAGRSAPSGFMNDSTSGSDSIVKTLRAASENPRIKAIVLRINSPGGSAAGSQEIYSEITRLREETGKPVIVSMGDVAASGGYYIASASDYIIANPATLTGSIGVIMKYLTYQGLLEKVGMEPVVLKSGEMKDIGSPFRDLTEDEKALLESVMVNIHEQFISDVAEGRELDIDMVREVADGRIFTGEQALGVELVDSVGGLQDALAFAAEQVGLPTPPDVELLQRENPFAMLFNTMGNLKPVSNPEGALKRLSEVMMLNPILADRL